MTDDLIYNRTYKLWRDGKFIGEAIWTEDINIGDSFIKLIVDKEHGVVREVFQADKWELITEENNKS